MSGTSPAAAAARTTVDLVVLRAATWRVELTREHPSLEDVDKAKAMFISCVTDALKGDGYSARRKVWSCASRRGPHRPQRHPSIARRTLSTSNSFTSNSGSHVTGRDRSTTHPLLERFLDDENKHHDDTYIDMTCLHYAYNVPAPQKSPRTNKTKTTRRSAADRRCPDCRGARATALRAAHVAASDSNGDTMAMATP